MVENKRENVSETDILKHFKRNKKVCTYKEQY